MKYPIGIQDFQKLREEGFVYVDKTALVYDLPFRSDPRKVFLVGVNFSSATRNIQDWVVE